MVLSNSFFVNNKLKVKKNTLFYCHDFEIKNNDTATLRTPPDTADYLYYNAAQNLLKYCSSSNIPLSA